MTTIRLGNAGNLSFSDDNSNGDRIIVGNGINDTVSAHFSQYDTITLGNGAGDTVSAYFGYYPPHAPVIGANTTRLTSAMAPETA